MLKISLRILLNGKREIGRGTVPAQLHKDLGSSYMELELDGFQKLINLEASGITFIPL